MTLQAAPTTATLIEVCVGDAMGALGATAAGAGRLELVDNLAVGGTTPGIGTIRAVVSRVEIPVRVMIRPRGGDFVYSPIEAEAMLDDIAALRACLRPDDAPVEVVCGALTADRLVDRPLLMDLVAAAGPLPLVFHKAFDEIDDQFAALETLIDLGVSAILSSGGQPTALEGATRLAGLRDRAAGRISFTGAGGIRPHNAVDVVRGTGLDQIHFRAPLVGSPYETTDPAVVREVLDALAAAGL
jgi:copper homeostasis protein